MGVFEDALQNDPVIRQADANRLAARESKPQALAALLPQINGTAGWTRDHNSGIQTQLFSVPAPTTANPAATQLITAQLPDTIDATSYQWGLTLRQNVFSWSNWMALKAASHEVA